MGKVEEESNIYVSEYECGENGDQKETLSRARFFKVENNT